MGVLVVRAPIPQAPSPLALRFLQTGTTMTKDKSGGPHGPTGDECELWSEEDERELRLVLLSDQLSEIAYRVVDWHRVAVLGRAIVALAEKRELRQVK